MKRSKINSEHDVIKQAQRLARKRRKFLRVIDKVSKAAYSVVYSFLSKEPFATYDLPIEINNKVNIFIDSINSKIEIDTLPQNKKEFHLLNSDDIIKYTCYVIQTNFKDNGGVLEYYLSSMLSNEEFKDIQYSKINNAYIKFMTVYFLFRIAAHLRLDGYKLPRGLS